ncbi:hypothetical protein MYXO_03707 [Myxococcaceae bacterium]|jgi:uncharacterized membrane protein|nr:hypothetical protein MYXO_03707 [Myxococcaceae bacterium]
MSDAYVLLKWLHVLAACAYVGGSFANGLMKALADRAASADASASLLHAVVWSNRLLLVAPSGVLLVTGIAMALIAGLPLASGWVAEGLALFALLSLALAWAMRLEQHLARLASDAAARREELPPAYRTLGPLYAGLGLGATLAMLAVLYVMVAKRPIL